MLVHDLHFKPFLSESVIQTVVRNIATDLRRDYEGKVPLFIAVLNGAFMFAADLMKHYDAPCEITFVKLRSYSGTASTGNVRQLIGLEEDIRGRDVIVLEDIVDSGRTLSRFMPDLAALEPASLRLAALLTKPDSMEVPLEVHYTGLAVESHFLIGYGLDYDGHGRNSPAIWEKA